MKFHTLFRKVLSLFMAGISLGILCGACQGAETVVKVIVLAAKIREKPDIASPVIANVVKSTLLASPGKEGRWFKVLLPPDGSGRVLSGFIHETVVEVLSSADSPPAKTLSEPPSKTKAEREAPVRAERPREAPRPAAVEAAPPAGHKKLSFRPYLKLGLLLTPPSAADLGYVNVDENVDMDQYLDVKTANYGAGLQAFLSLPNNPGLKLGVDFGLQKLFSSRFDTGTADLPYIYEDYHDENEFDIYLLGLVELAPRGSPLFVQAGLGGHFVSWSWTQNYESKYQSIHETKSGLGFNFGLMAAAGMNLRIGDSISVPISFRLDYLARYGALITAGVVVGFSFD